MVAADVEKALRHVPLDDSTCAERDMVAKTPKQSAVTLGEYVVMSRSTSPTWTSEAGWDVAGGKR
ncbi:hypothetical protein GCM10009764_55960 [Nocardia ninae]|uniref:Uncharacterized protein n=1 Tax=Nocardia ninae NBRC 108245 TaxID=1210091 RepID=A0A511M547_9NOCA|nr:hypothetical protein NN4_02710 [Nocardia ninae NBRC 108245]